MVYLWHVRNEMWGQIYLAQIWRTKKGEDKRAEAREEIWENKTPKFEAKPEATKPPELQLGGEFGGGDSTPKDSRQWTGGSLSLSGSLRRPADGGAWSRTLIATSLMAFPMSLRRPEPFRGRPMFLHLWPCSAYLPYVSTPSCLPQVPYFYPLFFSCFFISLRIKR